MKITLYTPDGTAETFTDCVVRAVPLTEIPENPLVFTGNDSWKTRRKIFTTLPYRLEQEAEARSLPAFDGTLVAGLMDLVDEVTEPKQ